MCLSGEVELMTISKYVTRAIHLYLRLLCYHSRRNPTEGLLHTVVLLLHALFASSLDCSIAREKNSRAAWFRSMIIACAREYATLACVEVTPTYVFWLALSEHRVNGGWPGSFDMGWLGSARIGSVRRRARVNGVLV